MMCMVMEMHVGTIILKCVFLALELRSTECEAALMMKQLSDDEAALMIASELTEEYNQADC